MSVAPTTENFKSPGALVQTQLPGPQSQGPDSVGLGGPDNLPF